MKKTLILLVCLFGYLSFSQAERKVDSIAVRLLDKMSRVIGELESVSFTLETQHDELSDDFDLIRNFGKSTVHFSGPDKMSVHSTGEKGNRAMWYNGTLLNYYSFDENNYVTLDAPSDTMTMIDSMNTTFGIDFPGADLFYPTLTDDILENFDKVVYIGRASIEGKDCFHILATSETMNLQLWISNNAFFLPKKYLFTFKNNDRKQYEGTFSDWHINVDLPDSMFDFVPPKGARLISILAKN